MLAAITAQLRDALQSRKVPHPVVYGPERLVQSSAVLPHIVIERDRQQGDTVGPPKTRSKNPQRVFVRGIGAVARVFCQSTLAGAGIEDHERDADKVINQLLVALRGIVLARKSDLRVSSSRFLTSAELAEAGLTYPGVVYEMRFVVDMGVADGNYAAETAAESTFGGVGGTTVSTTLDLTDSPEPTTDLPGATTR